MSVNHLMDLYIAMVNLLPAREKYPAELSGGMRQRVSVARLGHGS
jgi:nitrate/nitrite transport system ATP-binding protein